MHRAYLAGASPKELARHVGVSHDTVLIAFREAGLSIRSPDEWGTLHRERTDGALRPTVLKTFKATRSVTATAEVTGTGYERVRRVLSEADVDVKGHAPWRDGRRIGPDRLSREDARTVLRRAGRMPRGPLTAKRYSELARNRGRSSRPPWPFRHRP
ncbi:MAG: hypothetical protein ACRDV4_07185 [Acidimicrobiales bacterium]